MVVGKAGVPWLPQWKRPLLTLYNGRVNTYFLPMLQVELISAHFAVSQNQAQWRALYLLTQDCPLDHWTIGPVGQPINASQARPPMGPWSHGGPGSFTG